MGLVDWEGGSNGDDKEISGTLLVVHGVASTKINHKPYVATTAFMVKKASVVLKAITPQHFTTLLRHMMSLRVLLIINLHRYLQTVS
ncbi:hypothetical protein SAMN04488518_10581 [Pseudovibrio ascidiaceicola]|uniref:Uncharacterized protein n=1 Tax=Pseudovibrio ascidiaceicola TaxID=285279 RepID=A0A1I3ZG81_9HYPH|nr:hypothetical protein SAMN04488518_10581 [Pseudovibrio ascidiaceicola]